MAGLIKKFLASASVVAGMSAVFGAPAMAAGFTVTTADENTPAVAGVDYYLYEQDGNQTVRNNSAVLEDILQGNSSSPGGNIELGIHDDGTNEEVQLRVENNDGDVAIFRNMTAADWDVVQGNNKTVGQNWFAGVWAQANLGNLLDFINPGYSSFIMSTANDYVSQGYFSNYNDASEYLTNYYAADAGFTESNLYDTFKTGGGFGMIGDPNISYIIKDGDDAKVGLAGHFNLADRFRDIPLLAALLEGVQASEVLAIEIDGATDYLWSYQATDSKLTEEKDGISHNGNYEVTIEGAGGILPEDIPEPSTLLGLMAIGSLVAATKRKSQK